MDREEGAKEKKKTNLNSCLERQERVARVAHLEDASEPILGKVTDLEYLQLRRHGAEVELGHKDVVDYYRRLRGLVQGGREQVARALIEARVGRERRPVEVEGHVKVAVMRPWRGAVVVASLGRISWDGARAGVFCGGGKGARAGQKGVRRSEFGVSYVDLCKGRSEGRRGEYSTATVW